MLLYGSFDEKGYKFEAHIPNADAEPIAFDVRILIGDKLKHSVLVPMFHTPVFGVDVDDCRNLESITDRIIELLPETQEFGYNTVSALQELEVEIGGKSVRDDHARRLASNQLNGNFEYTADLFASRFAILLSGKEGADKWMKTREPKLGDRTPEEALRVGMVQEVMKCLHDIAEQAQFGAGGASSAPPDQ